MNQEKLHRVRPRLDELLPTQEARVAFEEASAALEAGRLVRQMRQMAGLSQTALAGRLTITQERVSAIENGNGRDGPSYGTIKRIAAACGAKWPPAVIAEHEREAGASVQQAEGSARTKSSAGTTAVVNSGSLPGQRGNASFAVLNAVGRLLGNVVAVNIESRSGRTGRLSTKALKFDTQRNVLVARKTPEAKKVALQLSMTKADS